MSKPVVRLRARPPSPPAHLSPDARAFCERLLPAVSRTFALSIQSLPDGLCEAIRVGYLLCRVVDTIEDDRRQPPATRAALFDAFDAALSAATPAHRVGGGVRQAAHLEALAAACGLGTSEHDAELVRGAGHVLAAFAALSERERRAISPHVLEMSRGMREYSLRADREGGLRMRDQADLERYCYFVAGTVGELLTELFLDACPVPDDVRRELEARSVSFGLGLQLVNVLKDVAEDLERGDCFLPHATARAMGVPVERVLDPDARARALATVRAVSSEARRHLEQARAYTLSWPADGAGLAVRRFCAVPLALALATLREIELGDDALVAGRAPTVTRALVLRVFGDAALATREGLAEGRSTALLEELFEGARKARLERAARPPSPPARPR